MYNRNDSRDEGCAKTTAIALMAIPVIIVVSAVVNGFVLTKMWDWFIVPVFKLPTLSLAPAVGLGLLISFLTYQYNSQSGEDEKTLMETLITATLMAIFRPALVLLLGWLVQIFMNI